MAPTLTPEFQSIPLPKVAMPYPEMKKLGTFKIPLKSKSSYRPMPTGEFHWNMTTETGSGGSWSSNHASSSAHESRGDCGSEYVQRSMLAPHNTDVGNRHLGIPPGNGMMFNPDPYHWSRDNYFGPVIIKQEVMSNVAFIQSAPTTVILGTGNGYTRGSGNQDGIGHFKEASIVKQEVCSDDRASKFSHGSRSLDRTPPLPSSPDFIPMRHRFRPDSEITFSDSSEDEDDTHKRNAGYIEKKRKLESFKWEHKRSRVDGNHSLINGCGGEENHVNLKFSPSSCVNGRYPARDAMTEIIQIKSEDQDGRENLLRSVAGSSSEYTSRNGNGTNACYPNDRNNLDGENHGLIVIKQEPGLKLEENEEEDDEEDDVLVIGLSENERTEFIIWD